MRICRYEHQGRVSAGLYADTYIIPLVAATRSYSDATHARTLPMDGDDLLEFLPPAGRGSMLAHTLAEWIATAGADVVRPLRVPVEQVQLLVPVPRPNKVFFLAGNYAEHVREGGLTAAERAETFPWVFMKPPSTTLTAPGKPVRIPAISPGAIDWELELGVVIGKRVKGIKESEALSCVAGYTVFNDISNRKFCPNPQRKTRERDAFFDWLHGKWFDTFCPCGPCITSAQTIADPQRLKMQLRLNGQLKQDASTAQQIFSVAAVIEFISAMVTLEPGDMISTGTPAGVGHTTGTYLKPGDHLDATIDGIGTLVSPVEAEKA